MRSSQGEASLMDGIPKKIVFRNSTATKLRAADAWNDETMQSPKYKRATFAQKRLFAALMEEGPAALLPPQEREIMNGWRRFEKMRAEARAKQR
jgi:hypothetical protein